MSYFDHMPPLVRAALANADNAIPAEFIFQAYCALGEQAALALVQQLDAQCKTLFNDVPPVIRALPAWYHRTFNP